MLTLPIYLEYIHDLGGVKGLWTVATRNHHLWTMAAKGYHTQTLTTHQNEHNSTPRYTRIPSQRLHRKLAIYSQHHPSHKRSTQARFGTYLTFLRYQQLEPDA